MLARMAIFRVNDVSIPRALQPGSAEKIISAQRETKTPRVLKFC